MNGNSIRWIAIAFALGLCAAYALWGSGNSAAPLTPGNPSRVTPPVNTQTTATGTGTSASATTTDAGDGTLARVGVLYIKFDPPSIDFGDVSVGETKQHTVNVTNIFDKTIHLSYARGSCGCMKVELPAQDLAPGKSAPMKISFSGLPGKRPEAYHAEVGVAEAELPAFLDVKARILQIFELEPGDKLAFGRMKKGESKTLDVTIKKVDGKPFNIIHEPVATQKEISISKPAEVPGSNKSAYKFSVTVKPFRGIRLIEQFSILTDGHSDDKAAQIPVIVYAEVDGDAVSVDERLATSYDEKGKLQPFVTTIKRVTPGILVIESVTDSEGGTMTFKTEPADGNSVKVIMTMDTATRHKKPYGELRIKTNVEVEPIHVPYSLPRNPGAGFGQ